MSAPELGPFLRATVLAMRAAPLRAAPDAATRPLLDLELPADLRALLEAWTFHGRGARWALYERWYFTFELAPVAPAEVDRICKLLGGRDRPPSPPGIYVRVGRDAGGIEFFATVREGKTAVFGPEPGEERGDLDDFLVGLYERSDYEPEPVLAALDPALFPQTDSTGEVD